jgi:hypothetical protein
MTADSEVSQVYYQTAAKYGLTEEISKKLMDEILTESKSDR